MTAGPTAPSARRRLPATRRPLAWAVLGLLAAGLATLAFFWFGQSPPDRVGGADAVRLASSASLGGGNPYVFVTSPDGSVTWSAGGMGGATTVSGDVLSLQFTVSSGADRTVTYAADGLRPGDAAVAGPVRVEVLQVWDAWSSAKDVADLRVVFDRAQLGQAPVPADQLTVQRGSAG